MILGSARVASIFFVQPLDDRRAASARRDRAGARLVAQQELTDRRDVRQDSERVAAVTARARSLPLRSSRPPRGKIAKKTMHLSARRVVQRRPPRYGTSTMSVPAMMLNSSPATWGRGPGAGRRHGDLAG